MPLRWLAFNFCGFRQPESNKCRRILLECGLSLSLQATSRGSAHREIDEGATPCRYHPASASALEHGQVWNAETKTADEGLQRGRQQQQGAETAHQEQDRELCQERSIAG